MTPTQLALLRAQDLLVARLLELTAKITAGDEAAWPAFCEAATALAVIAPQTVPGGLGEAITTRQLADRLDLSPRTLLRRAKRDVVVACSRAGGHPDPHKAAVTWLPRPPRPRLAAEYSRPPSPRVPWGNVVRLTNELRSDHEIFRAIMLPILGPRTRIVRDAESAGLVPGRLGRLEWRGAEAAGPRRLSRVPPGAGNAVRPPLPAS